MICAARTMPSPVSRPADASILFPAACASARATTARIMGHRTHDPIEQINAATAVPSVRGGVYAPVPGGGPHCGEAPEGGAGGT